MRSATIILFAFATQAYGKEELAANDTAASRNNKVVEKSDAKLSHHLASNLLDDLADKLVDRAVSLSTRQTDLDNATPSKPHQADNMCVDNLVDKLTNKLVDEEIEEVVRDNLEMAGAVEVEGDGKGEMARECTINIHRRIQRTGRRGRLKNKRFSPRKHSRCRAAWAIKLIRLFAYKAMGVCDVRLDPLLNKYIYSKGDRWVPFRVRVRLTRKLDPDPNTAEEKMYTLVNYVPVISFKNLGTDAVDINDPIPTASEVYADCLGKTPPAAAGYKGFPDSRAYPRTDPLFQFR